MSGPVLVVNAPLTASAHATTDKLTTKAQKITIKLPWEIVTIFSDVLPADEEEDEDDIEAHEASIQRLKVRLQLHSCSPLHTSPRASGSGRRDTPNDERRIPTLFRLPTSFFHLA